MKETENQGNKQKKQNASNDETSKNGANVQCKKTNFTFTKVRLLFN